MTRAEMLRRVSERTGNQITPNVLRHAISQGKVPQPPKRAGWLDYSDEHVDSLISYVENDSRLAMVTH